MSRYIDADAIISFVDAGHLRNPLELAWSDNDVVDMIESRPTVDAVPVVRCEKCSHGIKNNGISDGWVLCTKPYVTDTVGAMMHPKDWFCADGERKDGEE